VAGDDFDARQARFEKDGAWVAGWATVTGI